MHSPKRFGGAPRAEVTSITGLSGEGTGLIGGWRRLKVAPRRRGVITIEVLGVLPIMLLFAVSVAEFSMAMQLQYRVAAVSRFGAKLASEQPRWGSASLATFNVPGRSELLAERIDRWLMSTGLSRSAAVLLEHNACGVPGTSQLVMADGVTAPDLSLLPPLPVADGAQDLCYVRVTVWLPLEQNLPNALRTFGLDWSGATIQHSTVFRVEEDNLPPEPAVDLLASRLPQGVRIDRSVDAQGKLRLLTDRSGALDLEFSASRSRDRESPAGSLSYRWTGDGSAVGRVDGSTYRMRLTVPAGSAASDFRVALDVSDQCSCSSKLEVPLEVRKYDTLGTP